MELIPGTEERPLESLHHTPPAYPSSLTIDENQKDSFESAYIRQHLANERTFLAWIRTTVAIMGVGLVTTSLHFELKTNANFYADLFIELIGISTLILGLVIMLFATYSYLQKRKGINEGTFHSTSVFVIVVSISIIIVTTIFGIYLFLAY